MWIAGLLADGLSRSKLKNKYKKREEGKVKKWIKQCERMIEIDQGNKMFGNK